mgnify:CR=1 FL=1
MKTERLSPTQIMTLTSAAIMGVDALLVQTQIVSLAGQDAWISLILSGIIAVISGSVIYYLATLYPDKDIPQIFLHIGGKFLGRLLLTPVLIYFLLYIALSFRVFSHALKVFLFDRTPIYAIITLMTLLTAYTVYQGIYVIGGVTDILFPLSKATILALILLSLSISKPSNIKPILFENTAEVVKAILPGYHHFSGAGIIGYILCYTAKDKGRYKWYIIAIAITVVLYVVLTIVSIMVFSAPGVLSLVFPTLTLSKSIEFPTTFLERFESITAVFWISIVFESIIVFFFASIRNFAVFLNVNEKYQKYLVYGHIPVLIIISQSVKLGRWILELFELLKYIYSVYSLLIFPLLVLTTLIVRKRRQSNETN